MIHGKMVFSKKFLGRCLAIIVFCSLGVAVYSNSFLSSFQFDDKNSIVENASIRDLFDLKAIWQFWPTRFIAYFSLALNYHFHQLNVFGYHLVNIGVHVGSAMLVWWLCLLTFSTPIMKVKKIAAHAGILSFFTGVVFLVHPLQTQAVTYIIQRTTSLAAFFYMLAICLYVKSRLLDRKVRVSSFYYFGSLLACVVAMFTKEMTITLPVVIALYEYYFLKENKSLERKFIIPFLLFLFIIPLTMLITQSVDFTRMRRMSESAPQITSLTYVLTEPRVMITYLRLFFVPIHQNLDYDYPLSKSLFEFPVAASVLLLLLILFIAVKLSRRCTLLSFGIFWIFLTVFPESSIIPIADVINEHRLYLPMAGYSFFLVVFLYYCFGRKNLLIMTFMLIFIVNWYALLTFTRNFDWIDNLTLWDDAVRKSPQKPRVYFNRGFAYISVNEDKKALADINKALTLMYKQIGKTRQGSEDYSSLPASAQGYAGAYNSLGGQFAEINLPELAVVLFKEAIKLDPSEGVYYSNLAAAYGDLRKFKEAIEAAKKTIALTPDSPDAHYNLSIACYFDGQCDCALEHLAIASRLGFQGARELVLKLKETCEQ